MLPNLISDYTKETKTKLVEELKKMFLETDPKAAIAALRGMAERSDQTFLLENISLPTLLIFGKNDKITNIETAEKMKTEISKSRLVIIKDAGHYSNLEQPLTFNKHLKEFIKTVSI